MILGGDEQKESFQLLRRFTAQLMASETINMIQKQQLIKADRKAEPNVHQNTDYCTESPQSRDAGQHQLLCEGFSREECNRSQITLGLSPNTLTQDKRSERRKIPTSSKPPDRDNKGTDPFSFSCSFHLTTFMRRHSFQTDLKTSEIH